MCSTTENKDKDYEQKDHRNKMCPSHTGKCHKQKSGNKRTEQPSFYGKSIFNIYIFTTQFSTEKHFCTLLSVPAGHCKC